MTTMRTSIHGRRMGLGPRNQIVSNEIEVTQSAVDAVITIAASQTSPRAITIQLNDSEGAAIAHIQSFALDVYLDALGAAWAVTGGSTGVAIGANGALQAHVAKLSFKGRTDATGLWTGTWTDSAHEAAYLGVQLPSGRTVFSAALTTA